MNDALNETVRFARFAAQALPVLLRWWESRKDAKLEEQLVALNTALDSSFDAARVALAQKYAERSASAPPSGRPLENTLTGGIARRFASGDPIRVPPQPSRAPVSSALSRPISEAVAEAEANMRDAGASAPAPAAPAPEPGPSKPQDGEQPSAGAETAPPTTKKRKGSAPS